MICSDFSQCDGFWFESVGFLTPWVAVTDFDAALVVNYFFGALAPLDFLAVCLVFVIYYIYIKFYFIITIFFKIEKNLKKN